MMRFVMGALTGLVLIGVALIALALAFPMESRPQKSAPEVKAAAPAATTKQAPKEVTDARADFNTALAQLVGSARHVSQVSDAQAVRSAAFADFARAQTGAVPDAKAKDGYMLIDPLPTPVSARVSERSVKEAYFETWDDLMQRCYAVVGLQQPMDETGLKSNGAERVSYTKAYTEQKWFSADKAFSLKVKTRRGDSKSGVLRTCILESNRFARVNKATVSQLKGRFHDWWARERFAQGTVDQKYPYKLAKQHRWYGGLTRFGSSQGCPIKVEFSEIKIGVETDAMLFLTESDKQGCKASSGSSPGGKVRVNRLPQASD